ncbi:helix-turn-helix domain-containing protein [Lacibacter sp. H407]|uniref:helix-turn-helix domain-containing protein n=1 Tax=Lacibacter sp. H407 TaxID=3133423 RepID=UPI0030BC4FBC
MQPHLHTTTKSNSQLPISCVLEQGLHIRIEDGLFISYSFLQSPGKAQLQNLYGKAGIKSNYQLFYCSNQQTAELLVCQTAADSLTNRRIIYKPGAVKQKNIQSDIIVALSFSSCWVEANYGNNASVIEDYIIQLQPLCSTNDLTAIINVESLQYLKKIISLLQRGATESLALRVNILGLLNQLFEKAAVMNEKANCKHLSYAVEMEALSAQLSSFLKIALPDLKVFAKEYNMSLSSLKRHFKKVHGKPIYEYYLEQKMMLARNIIQDSHRSVSQVAYELGYEDPNCLIKSFKKVYGISPGKLCA